MKRTDTHVQASLLPSTVHLKSVAALTTATLAHKGIYIIKNNL